MSKTLRTWRGASVDFQRAVNWTCVSLNIDDASQTPSFWERGKNPCLNWDAAVGVRTFHRFIFPKMAMSSKTF